MAGALAVAEARDDSTWPPSNLAEYYQSDAFLKQLTILQRRLERTYSNVDAEIIVYDVVSDLLVKEVERHSIYDKFMLKFATEGHFLRYLYEACCRKVIDNARSFQRRFRQLLDEESLEDTGMGPEETAIDAEERNRTAELVRELERTVISKLPTLDRLILKHRIDGKKFQEIADLLDIGVATVHRRHRAVIDKLANRLEGRMKAKKSGRRGKASA